MTTAFYRLLTSCVLVAAAACITPAGADEVRRETIRFAPGKSEATVQSRFKGYDTVVYTLAAEKGQTFTITFRPSSNMAYFNVLEPGKAEPVFVGSLAENSLRFSGTLATSGDYKVEVYQMRAGARRGETVRYTMRFAIDGGNPAGVKPLPPDFADSLSGGPDFWQVAGVAANDRLNIRSAASPRASVVASVGNGVSLRNRGCKLVSSSRWCEVETVGNNPKRGWVAGRFLREGAPPSNAGTANLLQLVADCPKLAAGDFNTKPNRIRTEGGARPGPEGFLVDATVNLGDQGIKPFACRYNRDGVYLGIMSKVNEGKL